MSEARNDIRSGAGGWVLAGLGAGLLARVVFIVVELIARPDISRVN